MSKPKEIAIPGKPYFAWPYENQTKMKHKILEYYWHIWVSKLGKYKDTMFVDCHGGCGAYVDTSTQEIGYGSSILVDKVASKINEKRDHNNYICVCEKESRYADNLALVWKDQDCSNLRRIKKEDFNTVIQDQKVKSFYSMHPSFFFIDPFGYDLSMQNLGKLMVHQGSEILINFMFDHLNRFLSLDGLDQQRDDYFGCHDWVGALNLMGNEREDFLVALYKRKLKETTKAKFVFAYRLCYPEKRHTYYYLVHATNDIEGIVNMKNSFAKLNYGKLEYLGRYKDELTFFDLDNYKYQSMATNILKQFQGRKITFVNLLEAIIEDVPFLERDLSEAVKSLEQEGKLTVQRVSSKRGRYRNEDLITFGNNL